MHASLNLPPATNLFNLLFTDAIARRCTRILMRFEGSEGHFLTGNEDPLTLTAQIPGGAFRLLLGRLKALMGLAPGSPPPLAGVIPFGSQEQTAQLAVAFRLLGGLEQAEIILTYPTVSPPSTQG